MRRSRTVVLLGLLLAGGASGLFGQEPAVPDSPYFPLKKGTTWEYKVKGQDVTLIMSVARYEKLDNKILCAVLETVQDKKVVATEFLHADKKGIHRMQLQGQKVEPPLLILKTGAKKGDSWTVESTVMGQKAKGTFTVDEEPVKVPFKDYAKVLVVRGLDFEAAGQKISTTCWFAEGVGMVKQEANLAGTKVELELVKFDMPQ